jgi:O-antigen ligase
MASASLKHPTDNAGRLAVLLFLALLPLATLVPYAPVPFWLTQDFVMRWAALAIGLLVLGRALLKRPLPTGLTLDFPDLLWLALTGWVLLSALNSRVPFQSLYSYRGFLALVLLWFSLRELWEKGRGWFPLFEKVFYATALIAAAGVLLDILGTNLDWPFIAPLHLLRQGTFLNQNIAAGFLGFGLLWGAHQKFNGRKVSWIGLALLLVAWGATESRGSLVAMVVTVVLYLVLNMARVEKVLSSWGRVQWSLFGGAVLFLAASVYVTVNRLLNAESIDPRAYFRIDIWISSLRMVQSQPLFGFGPGTYGDIYPYYRPAYFWNTTNPFAHNEFLQVAAECGLPALVVVLLLLWALGRKLFPRMTKTPAREAGPSLRIGELAFYLVLFETLHNMVDFTFHEWSHRLVLLAFTTYALGEGRREGEVNAALRFTAPAAWVVAVASLLFFTWSLGVGGFRDYLSRIYDVESVLWQQRGDDARSEAYALRSLSLRPNNENPWNSLGAIEDGRGKSAHSREERDKHFTLADEYFRKAVESSPYAEQPKVNQIQSLINRGQWTPALELQKRLLAEGPLVPNHFTGLGFIYLKMGRPKEAVGPAQQCIDQFPYFLPGYFTKAQALEALGRRVEALHTYEDAQHMLENIGQADPSGQVQPSIDRLKGRS